MAAFTYKTLTAADVDDIKAEATTADPPLDYASLLPAWEADHVAHTALAAAGDPDGIHADAIKTLEAAILDGRKKA